MPRTPRLSPRGLAALLMAIVLGPAIQDALAAWRPESDGCCAGMSCCRRSEPAACARGSHGDRCNGAHAGRTHSADARLSPSCGCRHSAPLGTANAREIAALVLPPSTLVPPAPAPLVSAPWHGLAAAWAHPPGTPPPRFPLRLG